MVSNPSMLQSVVQNPIFRQMFSNPSLMQNVIANNPMMSVSMMTSDSVFLCSSLWLVSETRISVALKHIQVHFIFLPTYLGYVHSCSSQVMYDCTCSNVLPDVAFLELIAFCKFYCPSDCQTVRNNSAGKRLVVESSC